jgi:hypothetical protein
MAAILLSVVTAMATAVAMKKQADKANATDPKCLPARNGDTPASKVP